MQGNQRVEKFKKVSRVLVDGTEIEATITKGKKFNKTRRGLGTKALFRNARDAQVNQCSISGVY